MLDFKDICDISALILMASWFNNVQQLFDITIYNPSAYTNYMRINAWILEINPAKGVAVPGEHTV